MVRSSYRLESEIAGQREPSAGCPSHPTGPLQRRLLPRQRRSSCRSDNPVRQAGGVGQDCPTYFLAGVIGISRPGNQAMRRDEAQAHPKRPSDEQAAEPTPDRQHRLPRASGQRSPAAPCAGQGGDRPERRREQGIGREPAPGRTTNGPHQAARDKTEGCNAEQRNAHQRRQEEQSEHVERTSAAELVFGCHFQERMPIASSVFLPEVSIKRRPQRSFFERINARAEPDTAVGSRPCRLPGRRVETSAALHQFPPLSPSCDHGPPRSGGVEPVRLTARRARSYDGRTSRGRRIAFRPGDNSIDGTPAPYRAICPPRCWRPLP